MAFFFGLFIGVVIGAAGMFIWAAMSSEEGDIERAAYWERIRANNAQDY